MIEEKLNFLEQNILKNTLFYDVEVQKLMNAEPGYLHCKGFFDYENMGIALIGTFSLENGYKVYSEKELFDFYTMSKYFGNVVGFNSKNFDDELLKANSCTIETTYDLLEEIRVASGQPRKYTKGVTRSGYNLNALAKANLEFAKSGSGAECPKLWQDGKLGKLVEYLLTDVKILVHLYAKRDRLIDPTDGRILNLLQNPEQESKFDETPF